MTDQAPHYSTSIILPSPELVAMVERKAAQGFPFFEDAVSVCLDASEKMDEARWLIGDMALLVCEDKKYGENMIGEFAKRINVSVDQAKEYRLMASYYEKSGRTDLLANLPILSYSHWKVAKRLKDKDLKDADGNTHIGDIADSIEFLYTCADGGWTIERARIEMDKLLGKEPKQPEEPTEKEGPILVLEAYVTDINGKVITLNTTNTDGLQKGVLYRVEVFAGESMGGDE